MNAQCVGIDWEGVEQARLRRDGSIVITRWFRADPKRKSRVVFRTGTADFEYYKARHQLNKPGSIGRILQGWYGTGWVDLSGHV